MQQIVAAEDRGGTMRPCPAIVCRTAVFALLAAFFLPGRLSAGELIRVAVADDIASVTIKASEGLLRSGLDAGTRLVITAASLGSGPLRVSARGTYVQMNSRSYRGALEVRKKRNGLLLVVNELDIEDYLKGVIAAEIPHDWEPEVLKAQAVAARTYALYQKRAAGSRAYHIVATVDSQVYGGRSAEHAAALEAVRATRDDVITYRGQVIPAFYHASCGGHTENAYDLWGIDAPYLQGVDCECQEISQYGLWEKRISAGVVVTSLQKLGFRLRDITGIEIDGITPAGRVRQLVIRHSGGALPVPAEKFRAALGYAVVPSVFFEPELSGSEIVLSGRGLGHGVGLCQWGAKEMARRGYDYRAILSHYYPGTQLQKRRTINP